MAQKPVTEARIAYEERNAIALICEYENTFTNRDFSWGDFYAKVEQEMFMNQEFDQAPHQNSWWPMGTNTSLRGMRLSTESL